MADKRETFDALEQPPPRTQWWGRPGGTQEFLAGSPEEAERLETLHQKNPSDPALTEKVRGAPLAPTGEPPAIPQRDIVGRLKESLTGGVTTPPTGDIREPGFTKQALQAAGSVILPGSIPEAAVMGATVAAPAVAGAIRGTSLLTQGARVATRVGIPTLAGETAEAATGGKPLRGAALGATAGLVGEAVVGAGSLVGNFLKRFGHLETARLDRLIRDRLGPQIGQAIEADIPALTSQVRNTSQMLRLTTEEGGRKILGKLFDRIDDEIVTALGKTPVSMPAESVAVARGVSAGAVPPGTVSVSAKEALEVTRLLRAKALRGKLDAIGFQARQSANAAQEALDSAITQANPVLGKRFTALREDYSKFMDLRDLLRDNPQALFPGETSGGPLLNVVRFGNEITDNIATISPERFPALHKAFSGAEPVGTRPVQSSLFGKMFGGPRVTAPMVPGGRARVAETPKFPTVRFPAAMEPGPVSVPVPGAKTAAGAATVSVPTTDALLDLLTERASGP